MNVIRRVEALESITGGDNKERLVIVVRRFTSEAEDPPGVRASTHLPAMVREFGETWAGFLDRLRGLTKHLPASYPLILFPTGAACR